MRFYCIARPEKNKDTIKSFEEVCIIKNIEFILIDPDTYDITQKIDLCKNSILYRVAAGYQSHQVEMHLINNNIFTTLYKTRLRVFFETSGIPLHDFLNIKIPKTINYVPKEIGLLKTYASQVGGFPLIIKTHGLSRGIGITKIDSLEDLISISEEIDTKNLTKTVMREYIEHDTNARLIVLGNKVIASMEYFKPVDDFRTNIGIPQIKVKKYPPKVEEMAIQAVNGMELELGGVDILVGLDGEYYLAEVNFPFNFSRVKDVTGKDIAAEILQFLILKAKAE